MMGHHRVRIIVLAAEYHGSDPVQLTREALNDDNKPAPHTHSGETTMNTLKALGRLPLASGVLLGFLLSGCDMGPGHMMGGSAVATQFASNGERIYFTGTSASGDLIRPTGGNLHMSMMGGACASCHGADRLGARLMPKIWVIAPPLTSVELFEAHDDGDVHGGHKRYSDDTLRRAVTRGVDPAGNPLDENMPRWLMSDRDWQDLLAYLRS